MHRPRRSLRRNPAGLSEIVGALFLILIVVTAATVLSYFVASYQKQLQQQENYNHERSLESLRILSVIPATSTPMSPDWATLNFTVVSLYINPSTITGLVLDGFGVRNYTAIGLNLATDTYQSIGVGAGGSLSLYPREQLYITISTMPGGLSSVYGSPTIPTYDYLQLSINTALLNQFTQVFIPPTAIGLITSLESLNGGAPSTVTLLDGSNSFQQGNGTLVQWNWTITNTSLPAMSPLPPTTTWANGEKVPYDFGYGGFRFNITLAVVNNFGLYDTDSFTYTAP